MAEMASKVAAKRGDRAPELAKVVALIRRTSMARCTGPYTEKEEQVLFPFISQMDQESIVAYPPSHACFRSVSHPIFMMEQQHESADHIVAELIRLTNHFEPPSWACVTHIALFSGLRDFEADLRQHVHLENDVLFPRAIQLETELKARS